MRISYIISAISLLAWITSCDNTIRNPVSESSGIIGALVAIEPTTGEILCMSPLPKDGEPNTNNKPFNMNYN